MSNTPKEMNHSITQENKKKSEEILKDHQLPERNHGTLKKLPDVLLSHLFGMLKMSDGLVLYRTNKHIRKILKADHFEWADGLRLDLCLMMDLTGSMDPHLQIVKQTMTNILTTLQQHELVRQTAGSSKTEQRRKFHVRGSWIEYRDYPDNPHTRVRNFTSDIPLIQRYIDKTQTSGGGDAEDVAGGLWEANHTLHWTSNPHCRALRVITLIFDRPPHGMGWNEDSYPNGAWDVIAEGDVNPFPEADWLKIAYDFKRKGIIVNPILCDNTIDELNLFGATLAEITGGKCIYLEQAKDLGQYLAAQLCADLELDEILTNQIKTLAEASAKSNGEELSEKDLTQQVLENISKNEELTLPNVDGVEVVTHPKSKALSMCRSVETARKLRILPDPTNQELIKRKMLMQGKSPVQEEPEAPTKQSNVPQGNTAVAGSAPGFLGHKPELDDSEIENGNGALKGPVLKHSQASLNSSVSSAGAVCKFYTPSVPTNLSACQSSSGAVSKHYVPSSKLNNLKSLLKPKVTTVSFPNVPMIPQSPQSNVQINDQEILEADASDNADEYADNLMSFASPMPINAMQQPSPANANGNANANPMSVVPIQKPSPLPMFKPLPLHMPPMPLLMSAKPVNIMTGKQNNRSTTPTQSVSAPGQGNLALQGANGNTPISSPGRSLLSQSLTGMAIQARIQNKIQNQGRSNSGSSSGSSSGAKKP